MPVEIIVVAGDEITLAVKKIEGVTYTWFEGKTQIGSGNEMTITPTIDTVYRVVAKNQCGEVEIQTMVVLKSRVGK